MSEEISISAKVSNGLIQIQINGNKIELIDDKQTVTIPRNEDHVLNWFVRAPTGASYSISITKPESIAFNHKAIIDSSRKDAGTYWFKV